MWSAIALAFGLAMDATAVSAARGLSPRPRELLLLPLWFGGFQAGMAALGWLAGRWAGAYIARWDHWVAFGLLTAIGGKMLLDAWRDHRRGDDAERSGSDAGPLGSMTRGRSGSDAGPLGSMTRGRSGSDAGPLGSMTRGRAPPPATIAVHLGLALATSIDAAAAGLTLPLVPVAPWLALVLIGGVTAACTATAYLAGRFVGERLGAKLSVLGGVVLIAIGVDVLVRGL
jgi:putative Mn2+ efflux pump MntP